MEDRGLLDGQEGLAREDVGIPERKLPAGHGRPDRLSPGNLLEHDVAEQTRSVGADRHRAPNRLKGLGVVDDVEGRIDRPGQGRAAGEQERRQADDQRHAPTERTDEAVGEPEQSCRRHGVDRDRKRDDGKHSDYSTGPGTRMSPPAGPCGPSVPAAPSAPFCAINAHSAGLESGEFVFEAISET